MDFADALHLFSRESNALEFATFDQALARKAEDASATIRVHLLEMRDP